MECPFCGLVFNSLLDFKVHTEEETNLSYCVNCDSWYDGLRFHSCLFDVTDNGIVCEECEAIFATFDMAYNHPCVSNCRFCGATLQEEEDAHDCLNMAQVGGGARIEQRQHFDGAASEYILYPDQIFVDVRLFMEAIRPTLRELIITREHMHLDSRIFCDVEVEFEKEVLNDQGNLSHVETLRHTIRLPPRSGVTEVSFDTYFLDLTRIIDEEIDHFVKERSGWRIKSFIKFSVNISRIPAMGGRGRLAVPTELKNAQWMVTLRMDSNDGNCFRDAVLYALAEQDGLFKNTRIRSISHLRALKLNQRYNLNFLDIETQGLFQIKDILAFEKANNMVVRVYNHNTKAYKGMIFPNKQIVTDNTRIIHLLLLTNIEDEDKLDGHYFPITNIQNMVRYYYRKKFNCRSFNRVCELCLQLFPKNVSDAKMQQHVSQCRNVTSQFERMPEDPWIQFSDDNKMTQPMNVVFADIESIIESKKNEQIHTAAYIGSYVKWHEHLESMDSHQVSIDYGPDCVLKFFERLESIIKINMEHESLSRQKIKITTEEELNFQKQTTCERCSKSFKNNLDKHRDHDHITGRFCKTICS